MIDQHVLDDLTDRARELRAGFADTAPAAWDPASAAAEFTVQAGHLALCLAHLSGSDTTCFDDPERPIHDVGDELADVVLAALSIAILSNAEPCLEPVPVEADDAAGALLVLLAAAGQLAEAAMIASGYRHTPTGHPPGVSSACGQTLAAADQLAVLLGVDLAGAFAAMHTDARRFLASLEGGER